MLKNGKNCCIRVCDQVKCYRNHLMLEAVCEIRAFIYAVECYF